MSGEKREIFYLLFPHTISYTTKCNHPLFNQFSFLAKAALFSHIIYFLDIAKTYRIKSAPPGRSTY